jgi:hypothetical protein
MVSFTPRPHYFQINSPWYQLDRRFVDPIAILEDMEKYNSILYRDSNSGPTGNQPVSGCYTDCAIAAPTRN